MQKAKLGFPISLFGQRSLRYLGGPMLNLTKPNKYSKVRRFLNLAQRLLRLVLLAIEIIERLLKLFR